MALSRYIAAPRKFTPPTRSIGTGANPINLQGLQSQYKIAGVNARGYRGTTPNTQAAMASQNVDPTDPLTTYQNKLRQQIEQGERFNQQLQQLRNNRTPQTKTGFQKKHDIAKRPRRVANAPVNPVFRQQAAQANNGFRAPAGASGNLRPDQLARSYGGAIVVPQAVSPLMNLGRAFEAYFGKPLKITDSYRSYAAQVRTKRSKGRLAATPGKSVHGWGRALDLGSSVNRRGSAEYNWMMQNAPKYGWVNPRWAQTTKIEPWHWEYVG